MKQICSASCATVLNQVSNYMDLFISVGLCVYLFIYLFYLLTFLSDDQQISVTLGVATTIPYKCLTYNISVCIAKKKFLICPV